jgi:glutathione synthase/RimK-type ligase-like ATP-grasp enzyme
LLSAVALITTASDLAADLLVLNLVRRGADFIRLNQEDFPAQIGVVWAGSDGANKVFLRGEALDLANVRSAWFRHGPGSPEVEATHPDRETFARLESSACLSGLWEGMNWWWMNRPSSVWKSGLKLGQLSRAESHGLCIPKTIATNCANEARAFVSAQRSIAKCVASSAYLHEGRKYSLFTTRIDLDHLDDEAMMLAPVIIQECIPNSYDLRVTVVGNKVFPVAIRKPNDVDESIGVQSMPILSVTTRLRYRPRWSIRAEALCTLTD